MPSGERADDHAWPRLLRVDPRVPVAVAATIVVVAWIIVIAVDLANIAGIADALWNPAWHHLFNNRPVEWSAWLLLAVSIPVYGYVAGHLHGAERPAAGAFFLLFGIGLALMLIEEAGDVRHDISHYARAHVGTVIGLPPRVYVDVAYFGLLALLPLYALVRHGHAVWRARRVRLYLFAGVGLYGLSAITSALRHFRGFYVRTGRWIDETIMGGRWPIRPGQSHDRAHFFVMDGMIEESLEILASACLLAVALAFVWELRRGGIPPE